MKTWLPWLRRDVPDERRITSSTWWNQQDRPLKIFPEWVDEVIYREYPSDVKRFNFTFLTDVERQVGPGGTSGRRPDKVFAKLIT